MDTDKAGQIFLILAGGALLFIGLLLFEDTRWHEIDLTEIDPYAQDIADFRRAISNWEHGQ